MGANRNESTGGTYFNVTDGKITRTITEDQLPENYDPRHYRVREGENADKTKWRKCEEIFMNLAGVIKNVYLSEPPFGGKQIRFMLEDDEGAYFLNVPYLSGNNLNGYGSDIAGRLCALKPSDLVGEEIALHPYKMEREDKPGKYNIGIGLRLQGGKIKSAFGKDGALASKIPQPVETTSIDGTSTWDYSQVNKTQYVIFEKWLEAFSKEATSDAFSGAVAQSQANVTPENNSAITAKKVVAEEVVTTQVTAPEPMVDITDDLPF